MSSQRICVFCGANPGSDPVYAETAERLGAAIAAAGYSLVYGGGRVGLMGTVADAALRAGGEVIGVIPEALTGREVEHTGVTELVVTDSMHTRKAAMADRSQGFIALPGGFGTLDEVLEILTWNQIGIIAKPVVFLDVGGYYESLFRFFDDAVTAGLIKVGAPRHGAPGHVGRRGDRGRGRAGAVEPEQVDRPVGAVSRGSARLRRQGDRLTGRELAARRVDLGAAVLADRGVRAERLQEVTELVHPLRATSRPSGSRASD